MPWGKRSRGVDVGFRAPDRLEESEVSQSQRVLVLNESAFLVDLCPLQAVRALPDVGPVRGGESEECKYGKVSDPGRFAPHCDYISAGRECARRDSHP